MMRLLLDTHIFVWAKTAERPLKPGVADAIVDPDNEVVVSLVSAWELCIKSAVGKLGGDSALLIGSQEQFEVVLNDSGFGLLQIRPEHIFKTLQLAMHHRDPFDRLIVAQALTERMTLITADTQLASYAGLSVEIGV